MIQGNTDSGTAIAVIDASHMYIYYRDEIKSLIRRDGTEADSDSIRTRAL